MQHDKGKGRILFLPLMPDKAGDTAALNRETNGRKPLLP